MRKKKKKSLTLKSWLPAKVPMELQYELAETAKKLLNIKAKQHITVEFRGGWGDPLGLASYAWCKVHMEGPHPLSTLIHELCHVKDFFDRKSFKGYNKRWANRVHEKRAVRDTKRILEGELSERRSGYRERCKELMSEITALLQEHRKEYKEQKKSRELKYVDLRFGEYAAGDFHCYVIDLSIDDSDNAERRAFGEWVLEHWNGKRFRCEIEGNEEMLSELAGELSFYSDMSEYNGGWERRSERLCQILKDYEESKKS